MRKRSRRLIVDFDLDVFRRLGTGGVRNYLWGVLCQWLGVVGLPDGFRRVSWLA